MPHFLTYNKSQIIEGRISPVPVPDLARFLALGKWNPWWVCPVFGTETAQLDRESLLFLWETTDPQMPYRLYLPVFDGDLHAMLEGGKNGLTLLVRGDLDAHPTETADLLIFHEGTNPYTVIEEAIAFLQETQQTFRLREEKRVPDYADLVGWCTWNAFYQDVTEEKVLAGLDSFRDGGFVPPLLILDDGWQDSRDSMLLSFGANPTKFPDGIAPLIRKAKADYGVRTFGVWHTLQGYWNGIDPDGELAKAYTLYASSGNADTFGGPFVPRVRSLVVPEQSARFFQEYYDILRKQGVDMTKVDNQSSLNLFTDGTDLGLISTMKAYQYAIQGAAHTHLDGNMLHCMCNTVETAYHTLSTPMWRNSEDYFPDKPGFYARHVHMNALSSVWSRTFAVGDWDMFQSHDKHAEFQAHARAVSGSPVYLSDKADALHDFELIARLSTSDGRALRLPHPSSVALDCLFVDCLKEPILLKVTNTIHDYGVIGVFHCVLPSENEEGEIVPEISERVSPEQIPGFVVSNEYVSWNSRSGETTFLSSEERVPVSLQAETSTVLTFSPLHHETAILGLTNKYCPPAAIVKYVWQDPTHAEIILKDGGTLMIYSKVALLRVDFEDSVLPFSQGDKPEISIIEVPIRGAEVRVLLKMGKRV